MKPTYMDSSSQFVDGLVSKTSPRESILGIPKVIPYARLPYIRISDSQM